jgi:hypothetical protein
LAAALGFGRDSGGPLCDICTDFNGFTIVAGFVPPPNAMMISYKSTNWREFIPEATPVNSYFFFFLRNAGKVPLPFTAFFLPFSINGLTVASVIDDIPFGTAFFFAMSISFHGIYA